TRFSKYAEYELIRYCVKPGIRIIGGAEKLLRYFIKNNEPSSIVSYCDRSKFTGSVYNKLGFTFVENTEPGYVWVGRHGEILSMYETQKQLLIEKGYGNLGDTEDEIMNNLGYLKVYNSGNSKYVLNISFI
ncbi:MAG: hypothetical protein IJ593_11040, partial [Lachnospiraceae bacterium]|nr:hypothetical protein [Lachnospiraceae bacterium]